MDEGKLLVARSHDVDNPSSDQTSISITNAINGRVLTLRTYQPSKNQNRSEWLTELYLVREEESLPDAITMLLLLKGLK
jgi:hypothetical protein